jgi:tRNA (adenine37-N6)-methyltransferase
MTGDPPSGRRENLTLKPIGVIRTGLSSPVPGPVPLLTPDELRARMAASPAGHERGRVEVFEEFAAGRADVEAYERLYLFFWLHQSTPPRDLAPFISPPRGIFATHSPSRPNPLGLTRVRLIDRQGRILIVEGVDMYDGTPLLDIKPYVERGAQEATIRAPHAGLTERRDAAAPARRRATPRGRDACPRRPRGAHSSVPC